MKPIRTGLLLACVAILVLTLILGGCSSGEGGQGGGIMYYPYTKILTEGEAANIAEVTDNRSKILFTEITPFVAAIEPGDVLVCNQSIPGAEYGFLSRVTGVSNQGGTVEVQVEPATIEDAIEQGEIVVNQTISLQALMSSALWTAGVEVMQVGGRYDFTYSPAAGVTITGYVLATADAQVHIEASFWDGLQEFEFIFSPGLGMRVSLTVEAAVSWDKNYTIAEIPGPPIPIWGPVTITPSIELVIGTDGAVTATIETSVTYERVYDVGIRYYNGTWSTINEVRGDGATLEPPSFRGQAEAKVYAGAVLSGTAGISYVAEAALRTKLLGNIRASGQIEAPPWQWQYDLELYLTAQVFADLKLLRIAEIGWESPTWEYPNPPYNLAYGVSGRVTTDGGEGLEGVQISFSGGHSSVTTDANGYWCKHLLRGAVEVTPEKIGYVTEYVFDPSRMTVTKSASNYDFQVLFMQVATHEHGTVGLKTDGTVVAVGYNGFGECNVGGWGNITQVAKGYFHTVGVKSDGTVVAAGPSGGDWPDFGQCNIGGWTDIVQVAAGWQHTVGLKADGTVVAVGSNGYGQCDVGGWINITQVATYSGHTVGLKSDGTVVAVGNADYGQCNVGSWTDIVQVAVGRWHTLGLKSDGTVVAVGDNQYGQCNVGGWINITQVTAGCDHTVGLKSDGAVVALGDNYYGQCNVGGWTNITQVSAGSGHSVGLKTDGTVVAVGNNYYGQCDVGGWDLSL